jgi:hypothetical protein
VTGHGAAPGPGQQLLLGQLVEVTADGGGRDSQRLSGLGYAELPILWYEIEQIIPPLVPGHGRTSGHGVPPMGDRAVAIFTLLCAV